MSPRFARLVRESWWLFVVAAFAWLALILATYTKTDRGWSFTGTGAAVGNKGGAAGAWLADLLLYLFGFSAWWWVVAGVVLVPGTLMIAAMIFTSTYFSFRDCFLTEPEAGAADAMAP